MSRTIPLARYLFTRLSQCGVQAVHGVPGDFTLKALDHLKASKLKWIGNCNELNAGYAADGYSRVRGLGAVFTTYGVGELSAINAVAGSYAENVPVIHIVGTPQWHLQQSKATVHHTLGDGRPRIFREIHEKVTVAQANLIDPDSAPEEIDHAIEQSLIHALPAYIEMPCDKINLPVSSERLETIQLNASARRSGDEEEEGHSLLERIYAAKQPLIIVDRADGVQFSMRDEINDFVRRSGIPTLTMPSGAGMIDHSLPNYFGVHSGPVGQIDTMTYVNSSDLVIAFGPMFADTQTLSWQVVPDAEKTVTIGKSYIKDGSSGQISHVDAKFTLQLLLSKIDPTYIATTTGVASLGNFRAIRAPILTSNDMNSPIDQTTFYLRLNRYLRPDDIVLLGNSTPILGGRDFVLPPRTQVIVSGMWFSMGHMLPAAQGAALAQKENSPRSRTILIDGDGNIQVSVQEMSTIIRQRLNVTIFIINNAGYAYERHIHGMDEDYNDLAPWRYLDAARFFGEEAVDDKEYEIRTYSLKTWRDLDEFLEAEHDNHRIGLRLLEVVIDKYDVPEKFKAVFKAAGERL